MIVIIIILVLLLCLDFYSTFKNMNRMKEGEPLITVTTLRLLFTWIFIISLFIVNVKINKERDKCPEYEQIQEPIYKLK